MVKIKLKKFLAEILILLVKTIFLLKKIVLFILNHFIYRPLKAILIFLFFKLIVNVYYKYILLYKKTKEINKKNNSRFYIFKKNYPIFLLALLFIVVTIGRVGSRTPFSQKVYKTALAQTIVSDFSVMEPEELIIEGGYEDRPSIAVQPGYLEQKDVLKNKIQVLVNTQEENDNILAGDSLGRPSVAQTTKAKDARQEIIGYIVEDGDTISSIAQEFGVSVETILWENNLTSRSLIRPGNSLKILPQTGLMHTVAKNETISGIAKKYNLSVDSIIEANNLDDNEVLKLNQKIFIPGGKKAVVPAAVSQPSYAGSSIVNNSPSASSPSTSYSGGKLLWPTEGHRITQYFSWNHKGLDIANKTGTPLYAAEAGTVEVAGWNAGGYGYYVVVNHGGGLKTLYAHASKLRVSVGDKVSRGDIVADMGSTGWSTGPHIHFEVRVNNVQQNPLNYIQ